ncbi:hypothetical protein CES87_05115 [Pseudomonas sp. ERMR1:02]|nr:hypothetical protein CES87_05115 [Pseudomonas sp. ERMR1:02]
MDPAHRKKRETLLEAAIKAGSWKAKYFDSVWSYRYTKVGDSKKQAFARLVELGGQGIPIAAYKIGTYLEGRMTACITGSMPQSTEEASTPWRR